MTLNIPQSLYAIGFAFLINTGYFIRKGIIEYKERPFWARIDLFWVCGGILTLIITMYGIFESNVKSEESLTLLQNDAFIQDIHFNSNRLLRNYCFQTNTLKNSDKNPTLDCLLSNQIEADISNPGFNFIGINAIEKDVEDSCKKRKCGSDIKYFSSLLEKFKSFSMKNRDVLVFKTSQTSPLTRTLLQIITLALIALILPMRIGKSFADLTREVKQKEEESKNL